MVDRTASPRPARDRLAEQLIAGLRELMQPACRIRLLRERPWASITFSGTRYCFEISPPSCSQQPVFAEAGTALTDHDFDLDGHFVADLLIIPTSPEAGQSCQVEILAIIDPVGQR